jgi:hypothetical protein
MDELREKCRQHFTPGEFCEFLGISVDALFLEFDYLIETYYKEIVEETCFEFENDDTD